MKTKFGNYLEKMMMKNNYTLEYIAKQTDSSLSVVGHYRKGIRIPKDDFVERFIEKFIRIDKEADEIRYIVAYDRTAQANSFARGKWYGIRQGKGTGGKGSRGSLLWR